MKNEKKSGKRAMQIAIYIVLSVWIILLAFLIGIYVLRLQGYQDFAAWKNRNVQEVVGTGVMTATPVPTVTEDNMPTVNPTQVPTLAPTQEPTQEPTPTVTPTPTLTPTPTPVIEVVRIESGEVITCEGLPEYFTGLSDIDETIREQIKNFTEEPEKLIYEGYRVENYYSAVFRKTELWNGQETEFLLPLVYDLTAKKQVQGSDLIKENYFPIIKERLQTAIVEMFPEEAGSAFTSYEEIYRKEDYQQFYLTEEYLVFYFGEESLTENGHLPFTYGVELSEAKAFFLYELNGTERKPYIRELDPNAKMVALTFDDGPHPNMEKKLIDLLAKYNARATFFFLGKRAGEWYPGSVKTVYDAGHEVASHTYTHEVDFSSAKLSQKPVMWQEFNATNLVLAKETGYAPDYIRLPGGSVGKWSLQFPQVLVNWDKDSIDYAEKKKENGAQIIYERLKNKPIEDGSVVLLHSIYENSYLAMELLIPYLQEQGFEFVTLSEMFYYKGVTPEYGVVYKDFVAEEAVEE